MYKLDFRKQVRAEGFSLSSARVVGVSFLFVSQVAIRTGHGTKLAGEDNGNHDDDNIKSNHHFYFTSTALRVLYTLFHLTPYESIRRKLLQPWFQRDCQSSTLRGFQLLFFLCVYGIIELISSSVTPSPKLPDKTQH